MPDSSERSPGVPHVDPVGDVDESFEDEFDDEFDDFEVPTTRLGAPARIVEDEPEADHEHDIAHQPDAPPEPEPRPITPRAYIPAPGPVAPTTPSAAPPDPPPLAPRPSTRDSARPPAPIPPAPSGTPPAAFDRPPSGASSPSPPPPPSPTGPTGPALGAPIGDAVAAPPPPPTADAVAPGAADHDLEELLDRFHADLGIEQSEAKDVGDELTDARDLERPDTPTIVVTTEGGLDFDPSFASLPARALGWLIDTVLVTLFVAPGVLIAISGGSSLVIILGVFVGFAGIIAACTLEARAVARSGRWVGNRVAKTKVVRAHNGANLDIGAAATRAVLRHLISPIFMFGYFPALFDGQRRTFHDRFASSVVTTRPREVWTPDEVARRD